KKRTFPFFSNFSSAVLHGFTCFTKVFQHGIVISLQFSFPFPYLVPNILISSHFPQFLKLPVEVKCNCGSRALPGFPGAVWMKSHHIESFSRNAKTKIFIGWITAYGWIPGLVIQLMDEL